MQKRRTATSLASLVLILASQSGWSQGQPVDRSPSSFRIEFLGKDPAADWAKAVLPLLDAGIVPIETLTLERGQEPCGAVLAKLRFSKLELGCSDEMKTIIIKLNPSLPASAPIGQVVRYPNLPIETMKWRAGFDTSIPEEKDRLDRVKQLWKKFKIDEKTAGTQRNLQFQGIATELPVPTTPQNYDLLQKIERFNKDLNRNETRAIAQEHESGTKQRYAVNTPIDWAQACITPPIPVVAPPSYISLLNGSVPKCASTCVKPGDPDCPEIVLVDQPVDPHPDLVAALGKSSSSTADNWCPFGPYDGARNHGTHLAGIMVSTGATTGFKGLAPNISLDSQNIPDLAIKKLLDDKYNSQRLKIYVYASQFKNDYPIIHQRTRLSKPPQVEDMLVASSGLWIVAAGQDPALEIGKLTPHSPMNLGDQRNVIVVTSCDDCYAPGARVSQWASYSSPSEGLVTVAAPGGSGAKPIPSTMNAMKYGLGYGTSQSAALVGGLAAAMAGCFPQRYSDATRLKQRIEAISRPPPFPDMHDKVSAGIIDASLAFYDPHLQLIKLAGDTLKPAKNIWFCRETVRLKILGEEEMEIGPISVKRLRGILRERLSDGSFGWRFKYQPKQGAVLVTTPPVELLSEAPNDAAMPLFYLEGGTDLPVKPILLKEVENLTIGLQGGGVPPNFKGCK